MQHRPIDYEKNMVKCHNGYFLSLAKSFRSFTSKVAKQDSLTVFDCIK